MTFSFRIFAVAIALAAPLSLGPEPAARAQTTSDPGASPKPMIVATHAAPPFAFKDASGEWQGISIALWKQIGEQMNLDTRFKAVSLADMIDGVADGRFDASIAAMTITPDREAKIDFTHPFYTTGFGIAVRNEGTGWLGLFTSLFSWAFVQAVAALAAVLAAVGLLTWLFERRRNPEEFGGPWWHGLGAGFWFSAVTMTTVGYGDKSPRSAGGRLVALVWMFAAIIIISTFTGMIASALTANRLSGKVAGPDDLPNATVGSVPQSASDGWLSERHVGFRDFKDVRAGLAALKAGTIDAFVYDKPLLQYRIKQQASDTLMLVPGTFGRQDYGIALPQGSPLREPVNETLLKFLQTDDWRDIVFKYLGSESS